MPRAPFINRAVLFCIVTTAPTLLQAQEACGDKAWDSIGVGAFHCPGGTCSFTPPRGPESAGFSFSTEPWMRAIDPSGPAAGLLQEGDVLVAVNGYLITTPVGTAELAHLDASTEAVLTIRRSSRLEEVRVRPRSTCRPPLILIGNVVLKSPSGDAGSPKMAEGRYPIIDFTTPNRRSQTAMDMSLGMTLRCPGCELSLGTEPRWLVQSYPVVEHVVAGGVAEEAGLQPGDEIRRVDRKDVLGDHKNNPLFSPPRSDFTIEVVRNGRTLSAPMNRRVNDKRIVIRSQPVSRIRIERGDEAWGSRLLNAVVHWWRATWREVTSDAASAGGSGQWVARGDTWGPRQFGLLFRSESETLFALESVEGKQVLRLPGNPIIADVIPGGPAARAGLTPGDVVTEVNGVSVLGPEGSHALLFPVTGEPVRLTYLRGALERHTTLVPKGE